MTDDPKPEAAPEPETSPAHVATLFYMPLPGDPAETSVRGVEFRAYESRALTQDEAGKVAHLDANPWFGPEIDAERHDRWKAITEAQEAVDAAHAALKAAHE